MKPRLVFIFSAVCLSTCGIILNFLMNEPSAFFIDNKEVPICSPACNTLATNGCIKYTCAEDAQRGGFACIPYFNASSEACAFNAAQLQISIENSNFVSSSSCNTQEAAASMRSYLFDNFGYTEDTVRIVATLAT